MIREKILKYMAVIVLAAVMLSMTMAAALYEKPVAEIKKEKDDLTILLTGDLMCQFRQQADASTGEGYDFDYQFDYVRDILTGGDLVIGNLETNIAKSSQLSIEQKRKQGWPWLRKLKRYLKENPKEKRKQPYLNAPSEYLSALKDAGFNALVNANNHNCDTGVTGLKETIEAQDKYNLPHTGIFNGEEEKRYLILEKKGIKIGLASYATYFNDTIADFSSSEQEKHLNAYSKERVEQDINDMREDGAEYVIVYFHSGTEYSLKPNERQLKYAPEIAEAGADYIICSHSHSVQKYDIISTEDKREVPICYATGNFISHMSRRNSNYAILVSLTLKKVDGKVKIQDERYYPCITLKENTETGKRYQVVPCTKEGYQAFQDEKIIKYLKKARKDIVQTVGQNIRAVD